MWLFKFVINNSDNETIMDNNANDGLIVESPLIEDVHEASNVESLKKRIQDVRKITAKLEILKEKRRIIPTCSTTIHEHKYNEEYVSSYDSTKIEKCEENEEEKIEKINDSKIEDIIRILPHLKNDMQTLSEKVKMYE